MEKGINKILPLLSNCRAKYKYLYDDNNNPLDIVSNKGLKMYEMAYVSRNGEYHGVCVEAQEDIRPILTDNIIKQALHSYLIYLSKKSDNTKKISKILGLDKYFNKYNDKYGEILIKYVIDQWLKINIKQTIFNDYDITDTNISKTDIDDIDNYVKTQRHHPINGKIKIIDVGLNTNTKEPVMPTEWIGRIFDNATQLHLEMDNLPYRKGKPPVSYCCIYSNSIKCNSIWKTIDQKDITNKYMLKICIDSNNNIFTSNNIIFTPDHHTIPKNTEFIYIEPYYVSYDPSIFIKTKNANQTKTDNVGYLSSLLQKCIRRGSDNHNLINEVCEKMNNSPTYTLPDHGFATVSGTRQLLWRTFISIIEDVKGYFVLIDKNTHNSIDMKTLCIMAIIAQNDPSIKLTQRSLNTIIITIQIILSYSEIWNWRLYRNILSHVLPQFLNKAQKYDNITESLDLALQHMPMMQNDKVMLECVKKYMNDDNNMKSVKTINQIKELYYDDIDNNNDIGNNNDMIIRFTGYDMHSKPTMLIELQGMIDYSIIKPPFGKNKNNVTRDIFIDTSYIPSLERLSKYIWNNVSSYNYRYNRNTYNIKYDPIFSITECKKLGLSQNIADKFDTNVIQTLFDLQEQIYNKSHKLMNNQPCSNKNIKWIESQNNAVNPKKEIIDKNIGRIAWLSMFGWKQKFQYKNKSYEMILAGPDDVNLCKIKKTVKNGSEYIEGDLRVEMQEYFLNQLCHREKEKEKYQLKPFAIIVLPDPPTGYIWDTNVIKNTKVSLAYDDKTNNFFVNNYPVKTLDLSSILMKIPYPIILSKELMDDDLISLIKLSTYSVLPSDYDTMEGFEDYDTLTIYRCNIVAECRREKNDNRVFDWKSQVIVNDSFRSKIWNQVYSKIFISDTNGVNGKYILTIGPCDRHGKKTNNSISYHFEGIIYRQICLLEALYPFALKRIGDSLRWKINKNVPEYYHMIDMIKELCNSRNVIIKTHNNTKNDVEIKINTNLWDHQKKTSERIFKGYIYEGKRGFGDASHVGAGKTLCALSICQKLYTYSHNVKNVNIQKNNIQKNNIHEFGGFLVLVPQIQLIKTWIDEITKHTTGFDIITQSANGDLDPSYVINKNTIVISTMGRIRDHPIHHQWFLVIIDECLSVQNKEALQTEEAWRQSSECSSKYGILLLSATFFRSRFDKMLYMMKMLKTGLPETKEYLDAILNESIVSNMTSISREWIININRIELNQKQKQQYNDIYKKNYSKGSETLYTALTKYIYDNVNYIDIFYDIITKLSNRKILIYTKSKTEADGIIESSRNIDNLISRYPDKTGKHVVLSYSEGTYGLNDLVIYDTILMRPPEPDKLPQIKGRLDRPGQKSNKLNIEYVVLKDTIEEASIIRLEMCNNFYSNYLMPLATFYDIAAKMGKIS